MKKSPKEYCYSRGPLVFFLTLFPSLFSAQRCRLGEVGYFHPAIIIRPLIGRREKRGGNV